MAKSLVNIDRMAADVTKSLSKETISTELSPTSHKRRYEPVGGEKKLRERIHKESAEFDRKGNLPYTFSAPDKPKRKKAVQCVECGHVVYGNINTVGMVCKACHKYVNVEEYKGE